MTGESVPVLPKLRGWPYARTLQKHPEAFNRPYFCLVAAGENGGLIAEILARLADCLKTALATHGNGLCFKQMLDSKAS